MLCTGSTCAETEIGEEIPVVRSHLLNPKLDASLVQVQVVSIHQSTLDLPTSDPTLNPPQQVCRGARQQTRCFPPTNSTASHARSCTGPSTITCSCACTCNGGCCSGNCFFCSLLPVHQARGALPIAARIAANMRPAHAPVRTHPHVPSLCRG